ncbi:hypothetical protein [Bacillus thuringiensis]|uniref:hypothetical protein n=1 Tax=Bacillus thuringiensis TaxID=1428 RepID=UPI00159BB18A|nr:hypothetical protein [Bacillus thuringiensis]
MTEKPEFVWGVISNTGDGNEHLWHLGVCLTEDEAYEKLSQHLDSSSWLGQIKVL